MTMVHKIICIGRQFGSGGHEIAVRTGAKLGIRVYEREIRRLASEEDCIFVGRCAGYVLRDAEVRLLKVFVRAPFEYRVRRKMAQEGLSPGKAVRMVKRMDKRRRAYYEHYTGQEWGSGCNLELDMGAQTADEAVEKIEKLYLAL